MKRTRWALTLGLLLATAAATQAKGRKADQALPDSAFASIEQGPQGQKIRRLPYRDSSGVVDPKRLRAALRMWKRVKWQDPTDAQPALALLTQAKQRLCQEGKMKCGKGRKKGKPKKAKV